MQDARSENKKKQDESVLLRHRREKHEGGDVEFEMKVLSSYQHSPLTRQCGEAVRIKEIDPKKRINNKQEYHQPGDVEISYRKNEKEFNIINKEKHHENYTTQDNSEETTLVETEEMNNQKKITEYFIQQIRKESEKCQETNESEDTHEEVEPISTQQWINDARERRLNEMRNRINCDKCNFKTTSLTALKLHENVNHKDKKEHKNRIKCDECDKKFNKESTFKTHMQKVHEGKKVLNVKRKLSAKVDGEAIRRTQEGQYENSKKRSTKKSNDIDVTAMY